VLLVNKWLAWLLFILTEPHSVASCWVSNWHSLSISNSKSRHWQRQSLPTCIHIVIATLICCWDISAIPVELRRVLVSFTTVLLPIMSRQFHTHTFTTSQTSLKTIYTPWLKKPNIDHFQNSFIGSLNIPPHLTVPYITAHGSYWRNFWRKTGNQKDWTLNWKRFRKQDAPTKSKREQQTAVDEDQTNTSFIS